MKKGALRPQAFEDIRALWQDEKREDKLGIDIEDQQLNSLSESAGWKLLKQHIDNLKIGLDRRLAEAVLQGLSDEHIKRDATFSVLGKELLDSIVNKVEDSASIVEQIKHDKREAGDSK